MNCRKTHVASEAEVADLVQEYCSETSADPTDVLQDWKSKYFSGGKLLLRDAVGCDDCKDGYKGRVVVYELLNATPEIKHLVRSRATVPQLARVAQAEGMRSLRQNALDKVLQGSIDLASARAVAS
jgi:type II secretory ATPase GspE/PulE/Tfp pilus assembly ATPase PilB-like protein